MRQVALAEVKDDLSRFLRLAESEEIVITRHGKPAGILIGFGSEEDWSIIVWSTVRCFCDESPQRGRPCGPEAACGWKNCRRNG